MAVNAQGELVVLGSRRHLTLIELKEPQKVVRRISLTNKWDISHLFWNPSPANNQFLLTTVSASMLTVEHDSVQSVFAVQSVG